MIKFLVFLFLTTFSYSQYPDYNKNSYINDFANIIPDDKEPVLNNKILDVRNKGFAEITIVTVNSLMGESVETYTYELAKQWGVGSKDKNNGLVILVAPNERKWRCEVGYGLEGILTDSWLDNTTNSDLKPNFRNNDYFAGLNILLDDITKKLNPLTKEQLEQQIIIAEEEKKGTLIIFFGICSIAFIVGFIVILVPLLSKQRQRKLFNKNQELLKIRITKNSYYHKFVELKELIDYLIANKNLINKDLDLDKHEKNLNDIKSSVLEVYYSKDVIGKDDETMEKIQVSLNIPTNILTELKQIQKHIFTFNDFERQLSNYISWISDIEEKFKDIVKFNNSLYYKIDLAVEYSQITNKFKKYNRIIEKYKNELYEVIKNNIVENSTKFDEILNDLKNKKTCILTLFEVCQRYYTIEQKFLEFSNTTLTYLDQIESPTLKSTFNNRYKEILKSIKKHNKKELEYELAIITLYHNCNNFHNEIQSEISNQRVKNAEKERLRYSAASRSSRSSSYNSSSSSSSSYDSSSSSSSWSSSSSSSSSSFGGGDFGGGGDSGSW